MLGYRGLRQINGATQLANGLFSIDQLTQDEQSRRIRQFLQERRRFCGMLLQLTCDRKPVLLHVDNILELANVRKR
jgi:hypothetical protein